MFSSFFIFTLVNQLVPDPLDVATGQFLIKMSYISFVIKVQLSDLTTKDHHLTMPSSYIGKECDSSDDFSLRSFWRRSGLAGGSLDYGFQPFKLWVITLSSWARLFTLKGLVYPGDLMCTVLSLKSQPGYLRLTKTRAYFSHVHMLLVSYSCPQSLLNHLVNKNSVQEIALAN